MFALPESTDCAGIKDLLGLSWPPLSFEVNQRRLSSCHIFQEKLQVIKY